MSDKAYVLMATNGEAWGPVAVFFDEAKANKVAEVLNFRLFGNVTGHSLGYVEWAGFTVSTVDNNPKIEATTGQQYHVVDQDDPDWHKPMDVDYICDGGDPDDLYDKALMLEHGWMENYEYELREPEVKP